MLVFDVLLVLFMDQVILGNFLFCSFSLFVLFLIPLLMVDLFHRTLQPLYTRLALAAYDFAELSSEPIDLLQESLNELQQHNDDFNGKYLILSAPHGGGSLLLV